MTRLARCRHCRALVVPEAARCPICRGGDPAGRRFALVGALFLGALTGAAAAGLFAAAVWVGWDRWLGLFGDPDGLTADDTPAAVARLVGGGVFLLGAAAGGLLSAAGFRAGARAG